MNRGYIHLWRKSLDAGWIKNHKLWAFWTWCLLKASHKEFDAIVGLQIVHLMPGQFIFGLKKASAETGLSIQEIRTILEFLKKAGNLTVKTTNKFSIIYVINWHSYQSDEVKNNKQTNKPLTNHQQHTRTREHKNNTPVENFSKKILELKARYSNQEIIDRVFDALSSTRKSNRLADTVILGILQSWNRYPVESVLSGIQTYLQKGYAGQGRNEKYLLGIIRNAKEPDGVKLQGQATRSTGSALLDRYYKEQGAI